MKGDRVMPEPETRPCGVCSALSLETVTLSVRGKTLEKALCAEHLEELLSGARTLRRSSPTGAELLGKW